MTAIMYVYVTFELDEQGPFHADVTTTVEKGRFSREETYRNLPYEVMEDLWEACQKDGTEESRTDWTVTYRLDK